MHAGLEDEAFFGQLLSMTAKRERIEKEGYRQNACPYEIYSPYLRMKE
jgi:hypothetical protein